MNGKATKHLIILVLLGITVALVGLVLVHETIRFKPKKWLARHGEMAESYARMVLAGQTNTVPTTFPNVKVESGKEWVSFSIPVGPFFAHGMAFSPSGKKPEYGLGGEPEIKQWKYIESNWYYWVAD